MTYTPTHAVEDKRQAGRQNYTVVLVQIPQFCP